MEFLPIGMSLFERQLMVFLPHLGVGDSHSLGLVKNEMSIDISASGDAYRSWIGGERASSLPRQRPRERGCWHLRSSSLCQHREGGSGGAEWEVACRRETASSPSPPFRPGGVRGQSP
jgi:hypothetical protein